MKRSHRTRHDSTSTNSYMRNDYFDDNSSVEMETTDHKRKSRNLSEKKRRDQFNILVSELCSMVSGDFSLTTGSPSGDTNSLIQQASTSSSQTSSQNNQKKIDKSSILRSTIDFLKFHSETNNKISKESSNASSPDDQKTYSDVKDTTSDSLNKDDTTLSTQNTSHISSSHKEIKRNDVWKPSSLSYEEFAQLMLEALDAFVLVMEANTCGNIIYASESIISLLGYDPSKFLHSQGCYSTGNKPSSAHTTLPSISVTSEHGTSVFDFVHDSEKSSFSGILTDRMGDPILDPYTSLTVHFKQNITSSPEKHPIYELVRLFGSFNTINDMTDVQIQKWSETPCFVSIGKLQTPKILKELRMIPSAGGSFHVNREFVSRHSLEWKFLFLDHRASTLIGYMPFEVLGTSGYEYYHWDDLNIVTSGHQNLMQTGEGTSSHYRFLTKGQQWIWIQTKSYITYHQWNSKPEFIVCTHRIVGYDENNPSHETNYKGSLDDNQKGRQTTQKDEPHDYKETLQRNLMETEITFPVISSSSPSAVAATPTSAGHKTSSQHHHRRSSIHKIQADSTLHMGNSSQSSHNSSSTASSSLNDHKTGNNHHPSHDSNQSCHKQPPLPDSYLPYPNSNNDDTQGYHKRSSFTYVTPTNLMIDPSSCDRHHQQNDYPSYHHQEEHHDTHQTTTLNLDTMRHITQSNNNIPNDNQPPLPESSTLSPNPDMANTTITHCIQQHHHPSAIINVSETQVHDFLRKRHQLLQEHIYQQQEELRRVEQQLLSANDYNMSEASMDQQNQPISISSQQSDGTHADLRSASYLNLSQISSGHPHIPLFQLANPTECYSNTSTEVQSTIHTSTGQLIFAHYNNDL